MTEKVILDAWPMISPCCYSHLESTFLEDLAKGAARVLLRGGAERYTGWLLRYEKMKDQKTLEAFSCSGLDVPVMLILISLEFDPVKEKASKPRTEFISPKLPVK